MPPLGSFFVVEYMNHRIQLLDHKGRHVYYLGEQGYHDGQFQFPEAMCLDADDNLFVVDSDNDRIQLWQSINGDKYTFELNLGHHGTVRARAPPARRMPSPTPGCVLTRTRTRTLT
jgi:hypothetical protein